jgi:hypothetical protein
MFVVVYIYEGQVLLSIALGLKAHNIVVNLNPNYSFSFVNDQLGDC